jgi:hypothetical protein
LAGKVAQAAEQVDRGHDNQGYFLAELFHRQNNLPFTKSKG